MHIDYAGPPWIPGSVLQKIGPVTYLVDTGDGRSWKCHVDQMKEFGGTRDDSQPDVTGSQSLNVDVPIPSFDVLPAEIAASNTEEQTLDTGDSGSTNTSGQSGMQQAEESRQDNTSPSRSQESVQDSEPSRSPARMTTTSQSTQKSYPTRQHHQPNWYGRNTN